MIVNMIPKVGSEILREDIQFVEKGVMGYKSFP